MEDKKRKPTNGSKKKDKEIIIEENNSFWRSPYRNKVLASLVIGIIIGLLIMSFFIPERIAKLENGEEVIVTLDDKNITANDLYNSLKEKEAITKLLDLIDLNILTLKYDLKDEDLNNIKANAEYYLNMYESYYGYSKEEFLQVNGFKSYDEFIESLKLEYLRDLYYNDYLGTLVTEKEINAYYKEHVFGDIEAKNILIEVTDQDNETEKLKLANEILDKIKKGMTFEEVKKKYKNKVTCEDLDKVTFDNNLEDEFVKALLNQKENTYSTKLVKTAYGYHIIYKGKQSDKQSLNEIKSRIIDVLAKEKEEENENLFNKSLVKLRKDAKLEIKDTQLKSQYEDYLSNTNK